MIQVEKIEKAASSNCNNKILVILVYREFRDSFYRSSNSVYFHKEFDKQNHLFKLTFLLLLYVHIAIQEYFIIVSRERLFLDNANLSAIFCET